MAEQSLLPVAKNKIAQEIVSRVDLLRTFTSTGISPDQLAAAIISEANSLSITQDKNVINDPRTIRSFVTSAFNCAVIGLIPGSALGHAYFVPFKSGRGESQYTLFQLIVGYRGLLDLAFSTEFLVQCCPELVLQGEEISLWHDTEGPQIKHTIPAIGRPKPDRNNVVAAYCTYKTKFNGRGLRYVTREELLAVDKGFGVWKTNWAAMALKTPIIRAAKHWRVTRQMAYALQMDEHVDRDAVQPALVSDDSPADVPSIDLSSLPVPGDV